MTEPFDVDREEQHRRSILAGAWPRIGSLVDVRVPGNGPGDLRYEQGPVVELVGGSAVVDLPAPFGPTPVSVVDCRRGLPRVPTLRARAEAQQAADLMPGTNALSPLGRPRTRAEVERRRADW
jgi:hypothetical protein